MLSVFFFCLAPALRAQEANPLTGNSVEAQTPQVSSNSLDVEVSSELQLELVFQNVFPVAEVVDQIKSALKIPVTSFRLTRSAVSLKVKLVKPEAEIIQQIQDLVGSRAKVNIVARIEDKALTAPQTFPNFVVPNSITP